MLLVLGFIQCLSHREDLLEEMLYVLARLVLTLVSLNVSSLGHFCCVSVSSCLSYILKCLVCVDTRVLGNVSVSTPSLSVYV